MLLSPGTVMVPEKGMEQGVILKLKRKENIELRGAYSNALLKTNRCRLAVDRGLSKGDCKMALHHENK